MLKRRDADFRAEILIECCCILVGFLFRFRFWLLVRCSSEFIWGEFYT